MGYVTERRNAALAASVQQAQAQAQAQEMSEADAKRVRDRHKTHLEHKRTLGARYRPPCLHGAQGQSWWPNDPCDSELCDTPSPATEARPNTGQMTQREMKAAIAHITETLSLKMDMHQRPLRVADFYPETNDKPGIYSGMSAEEYQRRRAHALNADTGCPC